MTTYRRTLCKNFIQFPSELLSCDHAPLQSAEKHLPSEHYGLRISRRSLLAVAATMMAKYGEGNAATSSHGNLEYRGGYLYWPSGRARAAAGIGGVRSDKKEGDGATPAGTFYLPFGMYRQDRIKLPMTDFPMIPLEQSYAWVSDPRDLNYNKLVKLPYPSVTEKLWRNDGIYDLILVVGYNFNPIRPGAGSAIFLHISRPNFSPTSGCIAVKRSILLKLITILGTDSTLTIRK
jgi:L,D-peptidoglycan transpeptidase YkuD (ErfK/YbiS/YcfS/YnhG family)